MSIHHKKYQICLLLNVNLHILVQGQFLPHLRWHEINGKYRIVLLLTLDIFALLAFKTFAKSCFVGTLAAEMGNCVCEHNSLTSCKERRGLKTLQYFDLYCIILKKREAGWKLCNSKLSPLAAD